MSNFVVKNREKLLWDLISKIRSNLDIFKIKKIAVRGLARIFNPDRCTIVEYDDFQRTLPIEACSEYLSSKKMHSMVGKNFDEEYDFYHMTGALTQMYLTQKQSVIHIENAAEYIKSNNLMGSKLEKYCVQSDFTSCVGVSIFENNKIKMFFTIKFREKKVLSPEDVQFIRVYTEQIYIAIKQSKIISQFKASFKKDKLLQKILNITIKSLDVDKITSTFIQEMAKKLDVYRAAFCRFDPDKNTFLVPAQHCEYLRDSRVPAYKELGEDFKANYAFFVKKLIDEKKIIIIKDRADFIQQHGLEETDDANSLYKFDISAAILVPVIYKNKLFGVYIFSYDKPNTFTQEDIDFIATVAKQTSIAIYQAELFEQNKRQSKREHMLSSVIMSLRKSLDTEKIITTFVQEVGKYLDAKKIFFSRYDPKTYSLLTPDETTEYIASSDVVRYQVIGRILDSYFPVFCEIIKNKQMFIIPNVEKFFKEHNIPQDTNTNLDSIRQFKFNTAIAFPIVIHNELLGFYGIEFEDETHLSEEDIEFLKIVAQQTSFAMSQAELFEQNKKRSAREKILREMVALIRKSTDEAKILKSYVFEMAKYLSASRIFFSKYDTDKNVFLTPTKDTECIIDHEMSSYVGAADHFDDMYPVVSNYMRNNKNPLVIENIEHFLKKFNIEGIGLANALKYKTKSSIIIPVVYEDKILGGYAIEYKEPFAFTQDDIDFIVAVSEQTKIALYQAELLFTLQKQLRNEALLRKIITRAASTLDMKNIQKTVKDIGKIVKADRCYFVEVDVENFKGLPVSAQSEYRSSVDIQTIVGYDFPVEDVWGFLESYFSVEDVSIFDYEKITQENKSENYGIISYAQRSNLKSGIGVPFYYMGKLFAILCIEYVNQKVIPNKDDLDFFRLVAKQVGIAFRQLKLYNEVKQTAERETLVRNVISAMSSLFDLKEIKKYITQVVGKEFNLDRCFIVEYDKEKNSFKDIEEGSEYRSSDEVKSIIGYNYAQRSINTYLQYPENFLSRDRLVATFKDTEEEIEVYLDKFTIIEGFYVSIIYRDELLGFLVGHFCNEGNYLRDEDCDAIRIIAKNVGIALCQSQLYLETKQTAQRERLLRDIITTTRSSLDIRQIKKTIVSEILKSINADMVSVFEYYQDAQKWETLDEYSEALSSKDRFRFKGLDVDLSPFKYFADIFRSKQELIFSDLEEFISTAGIRGSAEEQLLYRMQAESSICIPILYRDEVLGVLVVTFEKKYQAKKEQVDFIRSLSEQIGIALYQSRLFEKEKKARLKEKVLNDIVFAIRKSIDLNEMKKAIATEIAKHLKVDRVVIHLIDQKTGKYTVVDEFSEYCTIPNGFSYAGIDVENRKFAWSRDLLHSGKEILMPDFRSEIEKFVRKSPTVKKWLYKLGILSEYIFPIKYQDAQLANLYVIQESGIKNLSKDELDDIRYLMVQIGFALNQAITYQDLQSKIKQELLLRKVTETIRGSLDIKEIKQRIVDELGKTLGADRCYLRSFNIEEELFLAPDTEYLASEDISSLKNVEPDQEGLRYFFDQVIAQDGIYPVEVTKDFIIEHNIENKALDRYFKQVNIKSDFAMPVWSKKGELTFLVLHYIKDSFHITEEIRQLLILLSRQISLALEQSDLYNDLKTQAERELASRKVIDIMRSSLDLDKILNTVANELLTLFNVQRVFVGKLDFTDRKDYVEVTSGSQIQSFSELKDERFELVGGFWQEYIKKYNKIKIIDDVSHSDFPVKVKNAYVSIGVKSVIGMPIKTQEGIWGGIFLSSIDSYKKWTPDEISFLEGIVSQIDTAIRQAELYAFQKRVAYKESVLRSLISEIKLTRDLHQAYGKLLAYLARVFGLNRVLFLESSVILPEELHTKYEYVISSKDLSVNNLIFPTVCMEKFFELIHHLKPLIIDDVTGCHPKNTLVFFEKYKINAMLAVPLVKYSKEVKVLGFIVLCSEEKRKWADDEVDLINAICESVVSVIWEISKFIEIEDLRNSFVLTLAHDFQVPLIGEKLAIEFLLEKALQEGGKDRELLEEILENNSNIIALLNKSVDIYNYDAGKKTLLIDVYEASDVVNEAILLVKERSKKIVEIDFTLASKKMFIKVDKMEILKVLNTILDNAMEHTPKSDVVRVKYYSKDNRVIISIHNGGAAIPHETQDIIFKRYEMALAIERKIGAGTGLFLAKKIVEAHKGHIWFETSNEYGTIFYVSLPQVRLKHI